jgi:hypothetical protein
MKSDVKERTDGVLEYGGVEENTWSLEEGMNKRLENFV